MRKFALYSCTCHFGNSEHFGPPVRQLIGRTPGSRNALAGSVDALIDGGSFQSVIGLPRPAALETLPALNRHTFDQRPFDNQTEPCPTRMASPPGPTNCAV